MTEIPNPDKMSDEDRSMRMSDDPQPSVMPEMAQVEGKELKLMEPVPDIKARVADRTRKELDDQVEKEGATPQPDEVERYVRLRLRVEHGEVSIIGVKTVEGPLIQREQLHSGLVYEVTRDQKLVAVGDIPDAGMMRAFPPPEADPERVGHYISEMPSYEFTARIPQKEFSNWALPRLRIAVHRIKGEPPTQKLGSEPLGAQFDYDLREIASLKGIREADLPENILEDFRQALR